MSPSDVCQKCDGVGKLFVKLGIGAIIVCPVCEGSGWNPEALKRELEAQKSAIENVKL